MKVESTIDLATVYTREPDRDKHLKSADFFDSEKFPQMTFKSKKWAAAGRDYKVTGYLTIRGLTKDVTLTVTEVTPESKGMMGVTRVGAQMTGRINRKDFGVNWNNTLDAGGLALSDDVDLTLDISAITK